ncbi:ABC transporter ATP-binding protein [Candidatus Saccharibacteria bacterium CPR2]|nr:ABC transporter ATP-binding protein [Candidatus Saccharibacteria bacterium CPR2]
MSDQEIAIKVSNVSKSFQLPHEKRSSIKDTVINIFKHREFETQCVLEDISLDVKKGEFFGIIGRNGSGKSTLLKLLARIYTPNSGEITVNGSLTPFIELGVGFNPELTGRENIFLNGALLGFTRQEMLGMYDDIVDFSELRRFMDQKLKNYSSGMQVRLAFSIAIRARSDILLIDEVLAVGDLDFQKKCYNYFYNLKRKNRTVILVTHDMSAVRRFCSKGALIDKGKIKKIGSANEIAEMYENINLRLAEKRLQQPQEKKDKLKQKRQGTGEAEISLVETFNVDSKKSQNTFMQDEKIGVRISFKVNKTIPRPSLGFIFQDQQDITVFATNNWITDTQTQPVNKSDEIIYETIVDNVFTDGEFTITCAIENEEFTLIYDRIEYMHKFMIGGHKLAHATTHPHHSSTVTYKKSNKTKT